MDESYEAAMTRRLDDDISKARREYAAHCGAMRLLEPYRARFPGATVQGIAEMMSDVERRRLLELMVTAGAATIVDSPDFGEAHSNTGHEVQ